jgi:hypothetical protein
MWATMFHTHTKDRHNYNVFAYYICYNLPHFKGFVWNYLLQILDMLGFKGTDTPETLFKFLRTLFIWFIPHIYVSKIKIPFIKL